MTKNYHTLNEKQKEELGTKVRFIVGHKSYSYSDLLDLMKQDITILFSITENGLNVQCPKGVVIFDAISPQEKEYCIPLSNEPHEEEITYVGLRYGKRYKITTLLSYINTSSVFDEEKHQAYLHKFQDCQLTSKELSAPYEVDQQDGSMSFNIDTFFYEKVTKRVGTIKAGTNIPFQFVEDCVFFDTMAERDQEWSRIFEQKCNCGYCK